VVANASRGGAVPSACAGRCTHGLLSCGRLQMFNHRLHAPGDDEATQCSNRRKREKRDMPVPMVRQVQPDRDSQHLARRKRRLDCAHHAAAQSAAGTDRSRSRSLPSRSLRRTVRSRCARPRVSRSSARGRTTSFPARTRHRRTAAASCGRSDRRSPRSAALMPAALNAYSETTSPNSFGASLSAGMISAPIGAISMKSRMTANCRNASIATTVF